MKRYFSQLAHLVRARHLFLIFSGMALLMVSSALIELHQSRKELLDLMREEAHSLSETIITASRNILTTNQLMEEFIEERLLDNANLVKIFYERGMVNNEFLARVSQENHLYRINIFNRRGEKIFYSHPRTESDSLPSRFSPVQILALLFQGETDTLILGLRRARYRSGFRYAVAVAARDRSAIVVNMDANQLLQWRKQIGFGSLMRSLVNSPGIVYAALQDTSGILAASGNVRELQRIADSPFLQKALRDSMFLAHLTQFDSLEVFETVHPFYYHGEAIGLFRLGLSVHALKAINARIYRRIIFISIILILIGAILFTLLLVRQNLEVIHRQYSVVETYSNNIIQNVSDAIIVLESGKGIQIFNHAAERLLGRSAEEVLGKSLEAVFRPETCAQMFASANQMQEVQCTIGNKLHYLLVSRNEITDTEGRRMVILVIRDLTRYKQMEAQIQRRERLSAMGQLASGVAHEIRNPLNAIGTIIQQLDRDFEPRENGEEYHQLARLVYQEVRRINKTIENFLRFARPEPLRVQRFALEEFLRRLQKQYEAILRERGLRFELHLNWTGEVEWDRDKMQQVFVNLIQNAMDVLPQGGRISLTVKSNEKDELLIRFSDDGPGMPPEVRKKIFNLYFTTKARGTGVGLAIVQRIIDQHGGLITVESEEKRGTTFIITLPVRAKEMNERRSNHG